MAKLILPPMDLLQRSAATLAVLVGRRGDQPSRLARLSIRFCRVQLKAPRRKADQPAIELWAVEAREITPVPKGAARILWRMLTTLPVTHGQEAIQKVRWYAQRWQIEVLHKVLKSGCQIEQRQLETAPRLERVLSLDLVVAWRILALCKAARETPDDPISNWLPYAQWQALCAYMYRRTTPPKAIPGVQEAVRWLRAHAGEYGLDDIYFGGIVRPVRDTWSAGIYWFNQTVLDGVVNGGASVARGGSGVIMWIDRNVIDLVVNGAGTAMESFGKGLRTIQTGKVQWYAVGLFAGVVALAVFFIR